MGRGGGGAKSYDGEKAWCSIYHSILSAHTSTTFISRRGGERYRKTRICTSCLKGLHHGRINYKDTKPYMSAFLSVDLLTEFAAFCLTDFIDWRYTHSWFVFSTQLVNYCPHGWGGTILVYCVAPLLYLLSDLLPLPPPPPSQCTVYTDNV